MKITEQELAALLAKALREPGVADAMRAHDAANRVYSQAAQVTAYVEQTYTAAWTNPAMPDRCEDEIAERSTTGGTAVHAVYGGVVIRAGDSGDGWGPVVQITDADERTHQYGHLSALYVAPGDEVVAGQRIGLSGDSPTGSHLSYDVLSAGLPIARPSLYEITGQPPPTGRSTGAVAPTTWGEQGSA